MVMEVSWGMAMVGVVVYVVRVTVIVVARANRVIAVIIVGHDHSNILIGR